MASAQAPDGTSLQTAANLPSEDDSLMEVRMPPKAPEIAQIPHRRPGFLGLVEQSLQGFRRSQIDNRLLYSSPEVMSRGYGVPIGFYAPDILKIPQESSAEALIHGSEVFAEYVRVIFMDWDMNGTANHQVGQVNCYGKGTGRNAAVNDDGFFILFEDFQGKNFSDRDFERQVYDHPLNRGLIAVQKTWPTFDMIEKESYRYGANETRERRLTRDEYFVPTFEGSGERNISNRSRFVSQVQSILNDVPKQLKELETHTEKGARVMAQELFYTTYKIVDKLEQELQMAQCAFSNTLFNVNEARAAHENGEDWKGVSKWLLTQQPSVETSIDTAGDIKDSHSEGHCTPMLAAEKNTADNKRGPLMPEASPTHEKTRKRQCTKSKELESMVIEDLRRSIEESSQTTRDHTSCTEAREMGDTYPLLELEVEPESLSECSDSSESTPSPTARRTTTSKFPPMAQQDGPEA